MLVRWIDGSAAGVRFSLVAGFMRGEDFVPLKGGPRIIAQGASLDIPAMRELRDKLGFKPVAGGRPALWHHLDGKLSTFGLKAAVPGLRAYTVEREAVTVTPRLGESAPSAPAVMPPPSRSIPLPPMVLGRNLRDETVYSDPDGRGDYANVDYHVGVALSLPA